MNLATPSDSIGAAPAGAEVVARPVRPVASPDTPLECLLVEVWRRVLGRDDIGTRSRFAALGGDEARAAEVAAALREIDPRFDLDPPGPDTRIRDTMGAILARVGREALVVEARGGGRGKFFLCHGDWHTRGLYAAPLVRAIDPAWSVYLLRPADPVSELDRLEVMAVAYADEVERLQPTGPVLLGGFSVGGLLAREIAAVLTSRGRRVALVVMIDSVSPNARLSVGTLWRLSRFMARRVPRHAELFSNDLMPVLWGALWRVRRLRRTPPTRILAAIQKSVLNLKRQLALRALAAGPGMTARLDVTWFKILCNYKPRSRIDTHCVCITCDDNWDDWMYSPAPWRRYMRTVTRVRTPGDHLGCVTTGAPALGALITRSLHDAS